MEFPGKYLKAERGSRNLSLKEVSESTKIKERLLKDIEDDQYEHLPHPVYVKGFLDAYARYLGLDPNDIVLRYQEYLESRNLSKVSELKQRITLPKKRASLWLFFIFVMFLFMGGLIYYFSFNPLNHFLSSPEKKEPKSASSLPSPPTVEKGGVNDEQKRRKRI